MVLLVDRKRAVMFSLFEGLVDNVKEVKSDDVPKKVKHGDDTWDAQDKINRHIEDHLHRHLIHVSKQLSSFAEKNKINTILIGSHKNLFSKIIEQLPYPYRNKVKGTFTTELKAPFNEVLLKAEQAMQNIKEI